MKKKHKLLIIGFILIALALIIWMWGMGRLKKPALEAIPKTEKGMMPAGKDMISVEGTAPLSEPEEEAILVKVFKVSKSNFQDILPAMGTVRGVSEIEIRFEMNGVVSGINFQEGDIVKKGDIIASLVDKDAVLRLEYARSKLDAALANYETSKKKLEIYQGLYDAGAIIKAKLEEMSLESESTRLQAETVRVELALAQSELEKTFLIAPKAGVIGSKDVEAGEFVTPNTRIVTLMDIGEVFVEVGIVERDIKKIKMGQKAVIRVDTYPEVDFAGTIDSIFPVVEGRSRTLTCKVKLANPQKQLLPGMFARIEIYIVEFKNSIVIPSESLVYLTPELTAVPVVNSVSFPHEELEKGLRAGTIELRQVSVGYATSDYAYIPFGLREGELVVIEAPGVELKDGLKARVTAVEEGVL